MWTHINPITRVSFNTALQLFSDDPHFPRLDLPDDCVLVPVSNLLSRLYNAVFLYNIFISMPWFPAPVDLRVGHQTMEYMWNIKFKRLKKPPRFFVEISYWWYWIRPERWWSKNARFQVFCQEVDQYFPGFVPSLISLGYNRLSLQLLQEHNLPQLLNGTQLTLFYVLLMNIYSKYSPTPDLHCGSV